MSQTKEPLKKITAYHFVSEDCKLRYGDNRLVKVGETFSLPDDLTPELCERGMHASVKAIDALDYAPGPIVCLVEVWGDVEHGGDKLVGRHRKVLAMADATRPLHEFAVAQAETALKLVGETDERCWAALKAKIDWLDGKITDDDLARARRDAEAAWDAARDAARAAARAAAWAAAWAAARDAARDAARAAARDAARAAANEDLEARFKKLLGVAQ